MSDATPGGTNSPDHDSGVQTVPMARLQGPGFSPPPVGFVFLLLFCLAAVVIWMAIFPVVQTIIPMQVLNLDAANRYGDTSLIAALGALCPIVVFPLVGALSDRTASRFGRRRPWIIGGGIGAAAALLICANAPSVPVLILGWMLFNLFIYTAFACLLALLPDKVPVRQRALASAIVGLAAPFGILFGTILVGQLSNSIQLSYYVIAALLVVFLLLFALPLRETALPHEQLPPRGSGSFLAGFWIDPRTSPDFGWAWLSRFLTTMAYSIVQGYLLYFLKDAVHYQNPGQGVAAFQAFSAPGIILISVVSGIISDRIQRRKTFVITAGVLIGCSLLIMALLPQWTLVLLASLILGVGFGLYSSSDVALITQVLPSSRDHGKDMGVMQLSGNIPQVIAPLLCGAIIASLHSYLLLYLLGALCAFLGAAFIPRIKGVR